MLRSIGAVVLGYVVLALITIAGTSIAARLLLPRPTGAPAGSPPVLTPSYLTANLTVSALAAVVGGYVTARMAPGRPMAHVAVLALLILALSAMSARAPTSAGQPSWYNRILPLLGLVGVVVGGFLSTP